MKRKISTDDIYDAYASGKLYQFVVAENKLVAATKEASCDNRVSIGGYIAGIPFKETNDIGKTLLLVSMMFDRIEKIEEDLKSIKKLLNTKETK